VCDGFVVSKKNADDYIDDESDYSSDDILEED
jgi:hypothetical protein